MDRISKLKVSLIEPNSMFKIKYNTLNSKNSQAEEQTRKLKKSTTSLVESSKIINKVGDSKGFDKERKRKTYKRKSKGSVFKKFQMASRKEKNILDDIDHLEANVDPSDYIIDKLHTHLVQNDYISDNHQLTNLMNNILNKKSMIPETITETVTKKTKSYLLKKVRKGND